MYQRHQPLKSLSTCRVFLVLLLLSLAGTTVAETTVRAEVDRNQLSTDETLTLTLSADDILFSDEPDVSALETDFHILRRQQSSRSNIINGQLSSSRQWDYTLAPKREGDITIPSIAMGKYRTRPLTISVRAELRGQQRDTEQVFLESDISPAEGYVQAQLEYTVKVFTSVNFLEASLNEPALDNAVVENLGETRYRSLIDGRYYQVIERRYAVFPQTSGIFEVPPLTLQARVESYRSSLLDPGRLVIKRSQPHRVRVMPPPDSFKGNLWLPARSLVIDQQWSQPLDAVHVGDSLTRRLRISAEGLLGSQLPDLPDLTLSGAKLYPDQAKIDKSVDNQVLTGTRSESLAIIPTQTGTLQLPEIRIPWWNIDTGKQEVAVLPAQSLQVLPAPGTENINTADPGNKLAGDSDDSNRNLSEQARRSGALWPALLGSILLNLLLMAALLRQRRVRRKPPANKAATPVIAEKKAFKALFTAVHDNDTAAVRAALLTWAQTRWPAVTGLNQLANMIPSLALHCRQIDSCLYRPEHSPAPDTKAMLETLRAWRKSQTHNDACAPPPLAPLYSDPA